MPPNTPRLSTCMLATTKSSLFKVVFVSAALLGLSSTAAYADSAKIADTTAIELQLIHIPGVGDTIKSSLNRAESDTPVYTQITPDLTTGWTAGTFDDAHTFTCTLSGPNTCKYETEGNRVRGFVDSSDFDYQECLKKAEFDYHQAIEKANDAKGSYTRDLLRRAAEGSFNMSKLLCDANKP